MRPSSRIRYHCESMDQPSPAMSLLEELDRRQDEVLAQLEELDDRLAKLLSEYSSIRPMPVRHIVAPTETQREAA